MPGSVESEQPLTLSTLVDLHSFSFEDHHYEEEVSVGAEEVSQESTSVATSANSSEHKALRPMQPLHESLADIRAEVPPFAFEIGNHPFSSPYAHVPHLLDILPESTTLDCSGLFEVSEDALTPSILHSPATKNTEEDVVSFPFYSPFSSYITLLAKENGNHYDAVGKDDESAEAIASENGCN